jgi:septal ring-binding cell division protein DamX
MDENNKLFVFEKKEVVLIFFFIVLIAIISFTLGVRVGKGLSLKHDSYSQDDVKTIDLKSMDEEYVESVVEKPSQSEFESSMESKESAPKVDSQQSMEQRLREEMQKLATEDIKIEKPAKVDTKLEDENKLNQIEDANSTESTDMYNEQNDFSGKYTIQLYSNQSKSVAQDFADGFIAKGYDVIVNEVSIPGKGVWYRVSIGVFNTLNEAKDYLEKEKALFQENKYLIKQF